ncbi:MAG TPA: low affinity iron permease family protein [Drouetiella sp.]|jgi:low affinity Fe/Cu permease
MIEWIRRHSKIFLQSDFGIVVALLLSFIWSAQRLSAHQDIDLPTVVSFLGFVLLFLIERTHAQDMKAIHLKLDELLAALPGASNRLIKAEEAPESVLHLAHHALHEVASERAAHEPVSIEHSGFFEEHELIQTESPRTAIF